MDMSASNWVNSASCFRNCRLGDVIICSSRNLTRSAAFFFRAVSFTDELDLASNRTLLAHDGFDFRVTDELVSGLHEGTPGGRISSPPFEHNEIIFLIMLVGAIVQNVEQRDSSTDLGLIPVCSARAGLGLIRAYRSESSSVVKESHDLSPSTWSSLSDESWMANRMVEANEM